MRESPITAFNGEFAFLSNFYPCKVEFEGITFPTSEHAFQAAKTLDYDERMVIRYMMTPGKAKRAGRAVDLRPDWEQVKVSVMEEILRTKFSNPEICKLLLSTGDRILIEGNEWGDTIWGCIWNNGWKGENHLGKLLMKIRSDIRAL